MKRTTQPQILSTTLHLTIAIAAAIVLAATSPSAQAQTITVLHAFTDGADGGAPYAAVTLDHAGNLYGTTEAGANGDEGTVYKLSHAGSGWILDTLYTFDHPADPAFVVAGVVFGPDGALYGASEAGGTHGAGTVFSLRPPPSACKTALCSWSETTLYSFTGGGDGGGPYLGNLVFDSAGNIYGTTAFGGAHSLGTVFELVRSGNGWTETVLYSFTGGDDGNSPQNGLTFDSAGNLYGTTGYGGNLEAGTVFELSPSASGWTETVLYSFGSSGDAGTNPLGGIAIDSHGNLYGTTNTGGTGGAGSLWELTPSNGSWTLTVLQSFSGYEGPYDTPTLDAAGNVYGTSTFAGPDGDGVIVKLTPAGIGWNSTIYDFTGSNGAVPVAGVAIDANGNLYGTTVSGGRDWGVVWEITP